MIFRIFLQNCATWTSRHNLSNSYSIRRKFIVTMFGDSNITIFNQSYYVIPNIDHAIFITYYEIFNKNPTLSVQENAANNRMAAIHENAEKS